ncbi:hypothetical protein MJA45_00125 [Paenibacillus aurantius]|uniref:DUF5668 domain-containing protein n=1 Tax=Paenibacillus aurantius TaxID=2918900 RepID=A0AA96LD85_9BACL|nr:hypothetical protein [Paenibacillus aurantius]WNQ11526.1 hypothetical protein MJA45_00125 [Paenibacillus aurantius]
MKRWRVGTFSMGAALLLMGLSLLMSIGSGKDSAGLLLDWWPVIFLLLGGEILLHLFLSKEEKSMVSYDLFSLFIVGTLVAAGIGMAVLTSTGLVQELRMAAGRVERTRELPYIKQAVPAEVEKIVIQSAIPALKVDTMPDKELHLFGSYRVMDEDKETAAGPSVTEQEVASVRTVGRTLYVQVKELPRKRGLVDGYPSETATLVLPAGIPVERRGYGEEME